MAVLDRVTMDRRLRDRNQALVVAPTGKGLGMNKSRLVDFLNSPLHVVNVGLEGFAKELEAQGVSVIQVDWSPPAGGDPDMADLLSKLGV